MSPEKENTIILKTCHVLMLTWPLVAKSSAGGGDEAVVTGVRLAQGDQLTSEVRAPEALARVNPSARRAHRALEKNNSQERRGNSKVLHHGVFVCMFSVGKLV